jgi:hypothetical protein
MYGWRSSLFACDGRGGPRGEHATNGSHLVPWDPF